MCKKGTAAIGGVKAAVIRIVKTKRKAHDNLFLPRPNAIISWPVGVTARLSIQRNVLSKPMHDRDALNCSGASSAARTVF